MGTKIPKDLVEKKANRWLITFLENTLKDGTNEIAALRSKLAYTYWIIVILYVTMFFMGIVLLSVPAYAAFRGQLGALNSLISAGFGITDLATLFLFRPLDRIHKLMGDIGQINLTIDSFQDQVALRLLEINLEKDKRETIGKAAEHVKEAAKESIELIQTYFEERKAPRLRTSGRRASPEGRRRSPRGAGR